MQLSQAEIQNYFNFQQPSKLSAKLTFTLVPLHDVLRLLAAIAPLPHDPRLALALATLRLALIRQTPLSIAVTVLAPPVLQLRKAVITLHAPLAQLPGISGLADAADLATLHVASLGKVLARLRTRTRLAQAVVRVAEESFRAVLAAISAGVVATVLQKRLFHKQNLKSDLKRTHQAMARLGVALLAAAVTVAGQRFAHVVVDRFRFLVRQAWLEAVVSRAGVLAGKATVLGRAVAAFDSVGAVVLGARDEDSSIEGDVGEPGIGLLKF